MSPWMSRKEGGRGTRIAANTVGGRALRLKLNSMCLTPGRTLSIGLGGAVGARD